MLRRTWTLPALTVLLALPLLLRADAVRAADPDLEGDWEVQSGQRDGEDLPMPPADKGKVVMTFKGDVLTAKIADVTHTADAKSDPSMKTHTIDLTPKDGPEKGKPSAGIYDIDKDVLRLCIADTGKPRPTEFSAQKGSGWTLLTLKRPAK